MRPSFPLAVPAEASRTLRVVKASDLERLTRVDEKAAALARDAASTFSGLNTRAIASVAEKLRGFETAKLVDLPALREAAKAFESMRPIIAPQIAPQIAEALKGIDASTASVAEAFKRMEPPPFRFAKTLDDLKIASQFQPRLADAFKALQLPPAFSTAVAEALRGIPNVVGADLAPRAGEAVKQAVVLAAESAAVTDLIEDSLAEVDDMSTVERRELSADAVEAIVRLALLVAILARNSQAELASAALAVVAIFVVIYWRATGKLGD